MEIADAINHAQREAREADEQVVAARSRLARHLSLSAKSPGQQTLAHARAAVRRRVTMGGFTRLIDEDEGLPPPTRAPSYSTTSRLKKLLPDVSAGLVSTLLVLVLNVSGAGLVCADAALRPHVDILVVRGGALREASTGLIRREDVRDYEADRVEIYRSFRPGDVVRARVLSLGDARAYYLTTAAIELGVIFAQSAAGHTMAAVSWEELECPVTKERAFRMVAKPAEGAAAAAADDAT